jgi:hypothetical protein
VKHSITLIALSLCLQLPSARPQNTPNLFATKRFKIEFTRGDSIVSRGGEITERKDLGDPWPNNPMVLVVTGEKTATLEDNPSALMVYMTGLEAVTFLEAVQSGYVHELTIFMPYLPDKGGYTCIYTRYGAGSRDALAERYVGIAHPL